VRTGKHGSGIEKAGGCNASRYATYSTSDPASAVQSREPPCLDVVVREGPKWGPGVRVDVVLQLHDAESQGHLIRVPDAEILRTS
jgi:hypothetical protein